MIKTGLSPEILLPKQPKSDSETFRKVHCYI